MLKSYGLTELSLIKYHTTDKIPYEANGQQAKPKAQAEPDLPF
jgi:hypothetical protein